MFFNKDINDSGYNLLRNLGLTLKKHTSVPFGHQFIAHRKVFDEYSSFLKDNNVLEQVENFIKDNKQLIRKGDFISENYHNVRINAYVMEMIGCYWFAKQDYLYVPNALRSKSWYNADKVKERVNKWDTTT